MRGETNFAKRLFTDLQSYRVRVYLGVYIAFIAMLATSDTSCFRRFSVTITNTNAEQT